MSDSTVRLGPVFAQTAASARASSYEPTPFHCAHWRVSLDRPTTDRTPRRARPR
jgi:hypothetical protein